MTDQMSDRAQRIGPHVWAIPLTFMLPVAGGSFMPRLVHAYILDGAHERGLVDCGTIGCMSAVEAGIAAAGLMPGQIGRLIATHEHADHMGAALSLVRKYGWPVAAHVDARRWLEDAALQRAERPLLNFDLLMGGSITVDQPLHEGDELDLGDCRVRVLHTPGHSRGSQSLVIEPDGIIITGDALISAVAAPFYDDPSAVHASVETLRSALAGGMRMVSSHAATPSLVSEGALDDTAALVDRMEHAVRQARSELDMGDEDALVRRALDLGGWPQQAVMPLTRITVRSHLAQS